LRKKQKQNKIRGSFVFFVFGAAWSTFLLC
jgi:hypothetical protein